MDIMTLSEVAHYLKLAEKTVLRMVHKGEIPCLKIASQWRFVKTVIDQWLLSGMNNVNGKERDVFFRSEATLIPLSRLTSKDKIIIDCEPGSKEYILRQLIVPLIEDNTITNRDRFLEKLLQRERMVSTGVENGIALPHLRHPDQDIVLETSLVIGICKKGTNFESIDGRKTRLFFLICTNDEVLHLKILATIGRMIKTTNIQERFLKSEKSEEILHLLIEYEQQLLSVTQTVTSQ